MKYDKNKNTNLPSDPRTIKYLPEGTKVLTPAIATCIKQGDCSYACKFVAYDWAKGSSQVKGIDFDYYYNPVIYSKSFYKYFNYGNE